MQEREIAETRAWPQNMRESASDNIGVNAILKVRENKKADTQCDKREFESKNEKVRK